MGQQLVSNRARGEDRPRWPRRLLLVALCTAAALGLAACGSRPTVAASPAPTPAASVSASAASVSASAAALQHQFVSVVKQVSPSVVLIETSDGLGSGIVFDTKGDIVTNNHVVDSATSFQVTLANGRQYPGRLVGTFPPDDLAVIHVDAPGLRPAAFADSSSLAVGDLALAIGNPLGLQSSVTQGIVSALGRTVNEENGVALPDVIQTSAPINPGNSGGALVNLEGQVIGIPTLAATDPDLGGSAAPGIGFAIPSNIVRDIGGQLVARGKVVDSHRAFLGVQLAMTTSGGVLVVDVQAGSPAARAGISRGDLVTAVNGKPTPLPSALADVLATLDPGRSATVSLTRPDGSTRTVRVTLGEYRAGG